MRVFVVSLTAILVTFGAAWGQAGDKPIHERTEWSDIWIEQADQSDRPRVFLVGDSIVKGYYDGVKKRLDSKASFTRRERFCLDGRFSRRFSAFSSTRRLEYNWLTAA